MTAPFDDVMPTVRRLPLFKTLKPTGVARLRATVWVDGVPSTIKARTRSEPDWVYEAW